MAIQIIKKAEKLSLYQQNQILLQKEIMRQKEFLREIADGKRTFELEVDGTKAQEIMLREGQYGWRNPFVAEGKFPTMLETKRTVTGKLFNFGAISSTKAVENMRKEGARGAWMEELLSFGAKYPNFQIKFPIIALGSDWKSGLIFHSVPGLSADNFGRKVDIGGWLFNWHKDCRFLGIFDKNKVIN